MQPGSASQRKIQFLLHRWVSWMIPGGFNHKEKKFSIPVDPLNQWWFRSRGPVHKLLHIKLIVNNLLEELWWGRSISRRSWLKVLSSDSVRQHLCNHGKQNKTLAGGRRCCQHFSRYSGSKWHHWLEMEVELLRPSLFLSLSSDLRISDVFPDSDAGLDSGCYWPFSQTANIADKREMRRGQGHVEEEALGRILIHEEVVQEEPPAAWGHTRLELCVYVCGCVLRGRQRSSSGPRLPLGVLVHIFHLPYRAFPCSLPLQVPHHQNPPRLNNGHVCFHLNAF